MLETATQRQLCLEQLFNLSIAVISISRPACPEANLHGRFQRLRLALGASEPAAAEWADAFITQYSEPRRHYHTLRHVASMLDCLDNRRPLIDDETAVSLAIFFHHWVYDPRGKDNEMESIRCFERFANMVGLSAELRASVVEHIECTISHTLPTDDTAAGAAAATDLPLFLDFDLGVLARPANAYREYAAQIRQEFGHLDVDAYRAGRIKVLRSFLDRERLYFSEAFYRTREDDARQNLQAEITALEGGVLDAAWSGLLHGCSGRRRDRARIVTSSSGQASSHSWLV